MKLSLAAGVGSTVVALLLFSAADASSQYRNPRSSSIRQGASSRSRRRTRSVVHQEDEYDDDDDDDDDDAFHRSQSSTSSEGGSGYSSSPSLNENWELEESSSSTVSSSFCDFDDLKPTHTTKENTSTGIDETERILLALERNSKEEEDEIEISKRSTRKKKRKKKGTDLSSSSSSPPKSSKKKRRRKRKVTEPTIQGPKVPSINNRSNRKNSRRITERPLATRAFVSRTAAAKRKQPSVSSKAFTANIIVSSSSSPSSGGSSAGRQLPQPKSHPDRTTWEVPSYSHKISTMMNNKNNESKSSNAPRRPTPALPRTTRGTASSSIGGVGSTARTTVATAATTRSTRGTKTTVAAIAVTTRSTSTPGSTSTPWVRKFLAGRPKDRLLPLPRDYISDNFNLAQLPPIVERIGYQAMGDDAIPVAKALQQHRIAAAAKASQPSRSTSYPIYRRALRSILADPGAGASSADENSLLSSDEDLIIPPYAIQKASEALYLMLHARFVISPRGLEAIRHVMALDNTVFGKCVRSTCKGTGLLPYGYSNDYTSDASVPTVTTASRKEHDSCCHRYCPSCGEVWISWESKTDGCAWGPSWCHLFLLAFGSQVYAKELEAAASAAQAPQPPQPSPPARSFLPRSIKTRGAATALATAGSSNTGGSDRTVSEDLTRPTPSVFGFRIHPSTSFGRPLNEPSLRGGSND